MKNFFPVVGGLLLVVLLLSGARQPDAAEQGVRRMAADVARDLHQSGPKAWLDYFVHGPEFFMANNGTVQFRDFESAQSFLSKFSIDYPHVELAWSDLRIDVLNPNQAMMAAAYKETITDRHGKAGNYSGYFTGLAVLTHSGWKLRDVHWSSPASP